MSWIKEPHRFGFRSLATILVAYVFILLCELLEQLAVLSGLATSASKLAIWSAAVCVLLRLAVRAEVTRRFMVALVIFSVFSTAGFAVGVVRDVPEFDQLPWFGRNSAIRKSVSKVIFSIWACGISYVIYVLLQSIGERQRRIQQLHVELSRAGRVNVRGQMAAWIVHELSQPLAAINTYCSVGQEASAGDARLKDIFDKLVGEVARAGKIFHAIRTLAQSTANQHASVDVDALVHSVLELVETDLRRRHIRLDVDLGGGIPRVVVDSVQIQQVLLNLIRNAIDAMSQNGGERRLEVRASLLDDGFVEVAVRDSGEGISLENEPKLFDSFFTTRSEGMGMGLPICRTIVESHRGRIEMKRNAGRGVTFAFTLPTQSAAAEEEDAST
ncbi:MAG: sensor histidine kinase [Planctomycetaceae bacterium]